MILKEHKSTNGIIVSLCDESILGKKFSEGELILDLSADFYKGEKVSEDEAEKKCKRAYILNAVGEKSVELIKKLGFADEKNIIKIDNIPFVQCIVMHNEV